LDSRGSRATETRRTSSPNGAPPDVEPPAAEPRQHAERRPAGQPGELGQARLEQADVAAELVHQEAGDQSLVVGRHEGDRAVQGGEEAAAVDVADHEHR